MNCKLLKCAAVLASVLLIAACGGSDDDRLPTITTYATGLPSPRGLAFGPDGRLYVAEAGNGGALKPADTASARPTSTSTAPAPRATAGASFGCWPTARSKRSPTSCPA
jgi:hypothetical protein